MSEMPLLRQMLWNQPLAAETSLKVVRVWTGILIMRVFLLEKGAADTSVTTLDAHHLLWLCDVILYLQEGVVHFRQIVTHFRAAAVGMTMFWVLCLPMTKGKKGNSHIAVCCAKYLLRGKIIFCNDTVFATRGSTLSPRECQPSSWNTKL